MKTTSLNQILKQPIPMGQASASPFTEGKIKREFSEQFPSVPKAELTELALNALKAVYPKVCPKCGNTMDNDAVSDEALIACGHCRHKESRLSHTPLQNFKLPLWLVGNVLHSDYKRSEPVTAEEISKAVGCDVRIARKLRDRVTRIYQDAQSA